MSETRESLDAFLDDNWEFFGQFEERASQYLDSSTRRLPPEFYSGIRSGLLGALFSLQPGSELRICIVIDTNIVVQDCLRVARGQTSSTGRILASEYIEVLAPSQIHQEVERNLNRLLTDKAELELAKEHAASLLSQVNTADPRSEAAIGRARTLIGEGSPEDVQFLALAIERRSDAVVSRDKRAFDTQHDVPRWELGEAARGVLDLETGSLSIVLVGSAATALSEAVQAVLVSVIDALVEIATWAVALITGAIEQLAEAWSSLSPSVQFALLAIAAVGGIAALVGYLAHEGFHDWVNDKVEKAYDFLQQVGNGLVEALSTLWSVIKDLLDLIWNLMLPVTATAVGSAGVLIRRIRSLLERAQLEAAKD